VTLPALALAWVLSDPAVNVVVIGPRRPDQLAPPLAALDLPLSPAERMALTRIMPPGPTEPTQPG
jgi:aryl-alcohol dehydrogenase-like predicted oxidoreductase